jgi:hypothetical protein
MITVIITCSNVEASAIFTVTDEPSDNSLQSKISNLIAITSNVYGKFSKRRAVTLRYYSNDSLWYPLSPVN